MKETTPCGFCKKRLREVKQLIESEVTGALICCECISLAVDKLADSKSKSPFVCWAWTEDEP